MVFIFFTPHCLLLLRRAHFYSLTRWARKILSEGLLIPFLIKFSLTRSDIIKFLLWTSLFCMCQAKTYKRTTTTTMRERERKRQRWIVFNFLGYTTNFWIGSLLVLSFILSFLREVDDNEQIESEVIN